MASAIRSPVKSGIVEPVQPIFGSGPAVRGWSASTTVTTVTETVTGASVLPDLREGAGGGGGAERPRSGHQNPFGGAGTDQVTAVIERQAAGQLELDEAEKRADGPVASSAGARPAALVRLGRKRFIGGVVGTSGW